MKDLIEGFLHEVRNPLASIRSALKILAERTPEESPERRIIHEIQDQLGRIDNALSDLLDFTQISPPEPSPTDMNQIVERALQRIQGESQRQAVAIEKQLSPDLPAIRLDERQMELALLLLFSDILRAMPKGGKLVARTTLTSEGDILLEIGDTGESIPEIHMGRLFKPFLATHGRGAGTGLSKARRLVDQNGGFIEAKNRGDEGLTFRISFPPA